MAVDETAEDHGVAPEGLPLDDDYMGPRDLEVRTVRSADGTTIAYEKSGSGPAVVVIGGGLNDRAMFTPFATLLSDHFTVYNYDRRGRGDSEYGDPEQFSMQKEIEDLAAVIAETGEPTSVFANCTGGMIAIEAAAQGVPMAKLGLYEPPYNSPKATPEQIAQLKVYIEEDRREEAVTIFAKDMVRFITEDRLDYFKQHPAWAAFESMAPSALYDAIISVEYNDVPHAILPKVQVPTLILTGTDSSAAIRNACAEVSKEIPGAKLIVMEGEGHLFNQKSGAPVYTEFFSGEAA
ncbi:alpha/beta hydrolase [Kitasatospora sp. NPDC049285]|uniref:alpha/beta fold hydrolase n=1 Tax=Kitasatospora sp. NPDC049285 TaxID=3157096 RepID=UPI00344035AA